MTCDQTPQPPSPYHRLRVSAWAFAGLPPDAGKGVVTDTFLAYRQALFDAMIADIDPNRYDVSWNIVKRFADAESAAIQQLPDGSEAYTKALAHLQHLIKESYTYVPWG